LKFKFDQTTNEIDLSGLQSGVYVVKVEIEGKTAFKKLVKR
jgi:hypothetical protein